MSILDDEHWQAAFQQRRVWEENPGAFAYDCFGDPASPSGRLELDQDQVAVIQHIAHGHDVTWRACHGAGKTTTLAILVFWWLICRPVSKVPTTAPTWHQVKNVLWSEIMTWYERFRFRAYFEPAKTKLTARVRSAEWFAIGIASNRPQNIEGFHSPRLLYVVDEAKGVSDPIYEGIDGALTDGGQKIYVSTPGSRHGKFYESHFGRSAKFFTQVHTNGETARRVNKKWVAQKAEEWGVLSSIYISKVRGEFPQEGDDVVFPIDIIDAAVLAFQMTEDDETTPLVKHASKYAIGCDVARYGLNKTVAVGGSSSRMDILQAWEMASTTETTGRLLGMRREVPKPVDLFAVDDTGVGGGVTDQLRAASQPVEAVQFGGSPQDKEYFANKKAEITQSFRRTLEANLHAMKRGDAPTFALLDHDRLKGQMAAMRRRYGNKGTLSIVDPDDTTIPATELAPGLRVSPDHAHAAILSHYGATGATYAAVAGVTVDPDPGIHPRRYSSLIFGRRSRDEED